MVWGMNLPSGFGEFWPDGEFEGEDANSTESGWRIRLKSYFKAQTPEEQKRLFDYPGDDVGAAHFYPGYVSGKLIHEVGTKFSPDRPLSTPIEPHEPPQFFQTIKTYPSLGSLIMLNDRIVAVDASLKDIIDLLEPGVHQFFPIEIRMPKGAVVPKQYYTLAIGQYFDSFSPEQSKPSSWYKDGDYQFKHVDRKSDMAGLAFSSSVFGKAHLWRERRRREGLTCFSDELKAEIDRAELKVPLLYKMKAV